MLREKSPSSFEAHRAIDMIIIFIIKFIINLYYKQYVYTLSYFVSRPIQFLFADSVSPSDIYWLK